MYSIFVSPRLPVSLLCTALMLCLTQAQPAAAKPPGETNALPLTIDSVSLEGGQLVAHGLIGDQPFTAPITLSTSPNIADPTFQS